MLYRITNYYNIRSIVEGLLDGLLVGVLLIVILRLVAGVCVVNGSSMEPTLSNQEVLIINHLFPDYSRGSIVIAKTEACGMLVKRIVAVEGDEIDIDENSGIVLLNGEATDEPFVIGPTYPIGKQRYPIKIPKGTVFLMGDNRNCSIDSRSEELGVIAKTDLCGSLVISFNR